MLAGLTAAGVVGVVVAVSAGWRYGALLGRRRAWAGAVPPTPSTEPPTNDPRMDDGALLAAAADLLGAHLSDLADGGDGAGLAAAVEGISLAANAGRVRGGAPTPVPVGRVARMAVRRAGLDGVLRVDADPAAWAWADEPALVTATASLLADQSGAAGGGGGGAVTVERERDSVLLRLPAGAAAGPGREVAVCALAAMGVAADVHADVVTVTLPAASPP